jgi:hypothetical protein
MFSKLAGINADNLICDKCFEKGVDYFMRNKKIILSLVEKLMHILFNRNKSEHQLILTN